MACKEPMHNMMATDTEMQKKEGRMKEMPKMMKKKKGKAGKKNQMALQMAKKVASAKK